jgi:hypothetical protein
MPSSPDSLIFIEIDPEKEMINLWSRILTPNFSCAISFESEILKTCIETAPESFSE